MGTGGDDVFKRAQVHQREVTRGSRGAVDFLGQTADRHAVEAAVDQTSLDDFNAAVGLAADPEVNLRISRAVVILAGDDRLVLGNGVGEGVFPRELTEPREVVAVLGFRTGHHMGEQAGVGRAIFLTAEIDAVGSAVARRSIVECAHRREVARAEAAHGVVGLDVGQGVGVQEPEIGDQIADIIHGKRGFVDVPLGNKGPLCAMRTGDTDGGGEFVVHHQRERAVIVVIRTETVRNSHKTIRRASAGLVVDAVAHTEHRRERHVRCHRLYIRC